MRAWIAVSFVLTALTLAPGAAAYGWPVKPFDRQHPIRGTFGDPRYHLDVEGQISAFHFGVDIVARDGAPVYAVEPGVVVRSRAGSITIGKPSGRRFGYWHVAPVVRSGIHVRLHQLIGYVIPGWGHVHLAESIRGAYRNPLRKGALSPFDDHTVPTVASVQILTATDALAEDGHVSGAMDITADVYDTPPVTPPAPWELARVAPATVWWDLVAADGSIVDSAIPVSLVFSLPPNVDYPWMYAATSYQNKPHRPGNYVYWLAHALDTTAFADGSYTLVVSAADTRDNVGTVSVPLTIANGVAQRTTAGRSTGARTAAARRPS